MSNDYGYGDVEAVVKETQKSGTKYLQFKGDEKQSFQLRIASEPRYVIRHWVNNQPLPHENGKDCQYCGEQLPDQDRLEKVAQWAWIVIDRADNKPKIFKAPNSVALKIRDITQLVQKNKNHPNFGKPTYGNPVTWDAIVSRWKKTNGFFEYSVEPDPDSRGEMSAEEKALVAAANYNLEDELKGGQKSDHVGNYGHTNMETAPDVDPEQIPDNLGDSANQAVDEDDIPF